MYVEELRDQLSSGADVRENDGEHQNNTRDRTDKTR